VTWTCFGFLWVEWYIVFVASFVGMMIFSYFYTCLLTTGNLFRFGFTFVASFIIQLLFHLFGFWYIQSFGLFTFVLFFHSVFLFLFVCLSFVSWAVKFVLHLSVWWSIQFMFFLFWLIHSVYVVLLASWSSRYDPYRSPVRAPIFNNSQVYLPYGSAISSLNNWSTLRFCGSANINSWST
jgi:hypothetical protein